MTEKSTPAHKANLVSIQAMGELVEATETLGTDPELAATDMAPERLADAIALLQDVRRRLASTEAAFTDALGKKAGQGTGSLSDGRQFTIQRAQDRKEWDHEDWKRDARRQIVQGITGHIQIVEDLVDVQTGEVVTLATLLHEAVAQAQEVHGSTAPRSRALRALGLYASDYCTSSPAGWRFSAVAPTEKKGTATDA